MGLGQQQIMGSCVILLLDATGLGRPSVYSPGCFNSVSQGVKFTLPSPLVRKGKVPIYGTLTTGASRKTADTENGTQVLLFTQARAHTQHQVALTWHHVQAVSQPVVGGGVTHTDCHSWELRPWSQATSEGQGFSNVQTSVRSIT